MKTLITVFSLLCASCALAGTVVISWTNPTANTDGSPLTLASINVYRATSAAGPWTKIGGTTALNGSTVPSYYTDATAIDGITEFYAVTAVGNSGAESVHSAIVSKAIPASTPNAPTSVTIK